MAEKKYFRQGRTRLVEGEGVDPSIVPQTYEEFQADQARPGARGIEEYFEDKVAEAEARVATAVANRADNPSKASQAELTAAKAALETAQNSLTTLTDLTDVPKIEQLKILRENQVAQEEQARYEDKPTEDPGEGNIWSYSVAEGRWKKVKVSEPLTDTQRLMNSLTGDGSKENPYRYKDTGELFNGSLGFGDFVNGVLKSSGGSSTGAGYQEIGGVLQFNGKPFTGTFAGTVYENGVKKVTTTAVTATNTAVTATNTLTSAQQDVYSTIVDRLNRYNLGGLAPLIKKLAIEGATEATIMLRLQDEQIYQERFKANQSRISKGLKALTPTEYLTLEDDYRQVLRAYGLKQFDNDAYVSQFLANDISVSELSNRVVTAVQRVRNADPAVSSMLKNYYGITNNDLVAYVLDPNQQFQKIERQVAASEIGVAAGRQGFNIGVPVAEQLAAQGITQAEAQRGYATIADILPTAEKLSDIYGTTLESYGLAEGEQEVFNQLASAQRKRQRLVSREVAEFSGQAGVGRGSLATPTGGQY